VKRFLLLVAALLLSTVTSRAAEKETRVIELRVYTPNAGKQAAVNELIAKSGAKYMAKHNIELLGAWVPADANDERVLTLVAHKDQASAEKNWAAFRDDAGWKDDLAASSKDGRAVGSIATFYLNATDYSPMLKPANVGGRIFELRTYITTPNHLPNLNARFRDHTLKLFEKHGMTNIVYTTLVPGAKTTVGELLKALAPAKQETCGVAAETAAEPYALVYFLTHKSADAMKASFGSFRDDPAWNAARKASEEKAGGSLTADKGVKSLVLKPTDYSPLK
jgi:NIPSNAP